MEFAKLIYINEKKAITNGYLTTKHRKTLSLPLRDHKKRTFILINRKYHMICLPLGY